MAYKRKFKGEQRKLGAHVTPGLPVRLIDLSLETATDRRSRSGVALSPRGGSRHHPPVQKLAHP
jgi:hypothetical protein